MSFYVWCDWKGGRERLSCVIGRGEERNEKKIDMSKGNDLTNGLPRVGKIHPNIKDLKVWWNYMEVQSDLGS